MNLFLEKLSEYNETEVVEFALPKGCPKFCTGCFSCFLNGEQTCPHAEYTEPIVKALADSDLIILTSPVYGFDVTGQMKALLDHLCFMWLSHRPNPRLFQSVGLVITTTAGAGLSHTAKTMKNSLQFWGVKKAFTYKKAVAALKWEDIPEPKKAQIKKEIAALAAKVSKAAAGVSKLPTPLKTRFMFYLMKKMLKTGKWDNPCDRKHWESLGWLDGKKPF